MSQYSFKDITTIHTGDEFNNIMLSRTNRRTPTVIRRHFQISRIRKFYMMKVKYIVQQYTERFNMIVEQFPKIDSLHPFYAELLNTNYNKEHYKLALGQVNAMSHKIAKLGADYVSLLKYGDSLFRCKSLKKNCMGRIVKMVKKANSTFEFLEEVRQHLSRLPSIDPEEKTLLLCGCPNAGKSSFMNLLTRAEVEVQPYPFTTKSLYVGHMDYKYARWQVIDTPGILDRPLEDMNTIELQAVTALTHTKSAVLFFLDISETCDITIENQLKTFRCLFPLFEKQHKYLVCNKIDLMSLEELAEKSPEKRALIQEVEDQGIKAFEISTLEKTGVMDLRNMACERQLSQRVDHLCNTRKVEGILNRVFVAQPKGDNVNRPTCIPEKIRKSQEDKKYFSKITDTNPDYKLESKIEEEEAFDYSVDLCKNKLLENDEWKYDYVPRILNGKMVADFMCEDIEEKFKTLMEEEEVREQVGFYDTPDIGEFEVEADYRKFHRKIRDKIVINKINARLDSGTGKRPMARASRPRVMDRSTTSMRKEFEDVGVSMKNTENAGFTKTQKRGRSESRTVINNMGPDNKKIRNTKAAIRARSVSRTPRDQTGQADPEKREKLKALAKKAIKAKQPGGKKGESDRHIFNLKPRHLLSGKRGIGSADRR